MLLHEHKRGIIKFVKKLLVNFHSIYKTVHSTNHFALHCKYLFKLNKTKFKI